jgi:hypothetical protein
LRVTNLSGRANWQLGKLKLWPVKRENWKRHEQAVSKLVT